MRGTVLIVHGLGEHIGRYEEVAAHLAALGWNVAGYDQRGHGRSGGPRGAVRHADDFLADVGAMVDRLRSEATAAPTPFILFGHSMGALIAAQFTARALRPIDGLVLSSPPLAAELTVAQRMQLAIGLALVPDLAMSNQLPVDFLCRDLAVVNAYRADPLVHDRLTPRLARTLLDGGKEVLARAASWSVPTLLIWAGEDHLVAAAGSEAFAALAPAAVVRAQRFDGFYHEVLNDPERARVYALLDAWLAERSADAALNRQ